MLLVEEPCAIFSILVSSIGSDENLFTVVNNGLTFFDSGVSVNDKFRLDDFFDLSINLSLLTFVTEELKTSLDSLYTRISPNIYLEYPII